MLIQCKSPGCEHTLKLTTNSYDEVAEAGWVALPMAPSVGYICPNHEEQDA